MYGYLTAKEKTFGGDNLLSKEAMAAMVAAEEKRLGVNSPEFIRRHNEIMKKADEIQSRYKKNALPVPQILAGAQQSFNDNGLIQPRFAEYKTKGNGQSENSVMTAGAALRPPFSFPCKYPNFYP